MEHHTETSGHLERHSERNRDRDRSSETHRKTRKQRQEEMGQRKWTLQQRLTKLADEGEQLCAVV